MIHSLSSLKSQNVQPQEGSRAHQRARQGTASSEGGRQEAPKPLDRKQVEAAAEKLNSALSQMDGKYSVSVDDDTGMVVVRITDVETGEVVKQVPPQQILDVNVSMEKIIGLLVNDQA